MKKISDLFGNTLCLLLLCINIYCSAWEFAVPSKDPLAPLHISLERTQGRGVGFDHSYSSFAILAAPDIWERALPFADMRMHRFDSGKWAANLGFGARLPLEGLSSVLGANLFYDYRDGNKRAYHQAGLGVEWLNCDWELKANGYIPIGKNASKYYNPIFEGFQGNNFFISRKRELALGGVDIEAGYRWPMCTWFDLYTGVGAYYLKGEREQAGGIQADISAKFLHYFSLNLKAAHDKIFHSTFEAQLAISIPLGGNSCCDETCCCWDIPALLRSPVSRREIIALDKKRKTTAALDPDGEKPLRFIFVNNNNPQFGNGTFEDPYNTLSAAENASDAHDVLYIYAGDGTNRGMDAGIALKEGQLLLGSGMPQMIPTEEGIIFVHSETQNFPTLANNSGNGVELSNGNEVIGFNIEASDWGIHGAEIENAVIANNSFSGVLGQGGIGIESAKGKVIINHNSLSGSAAVLCTGISVRSRGSSSADIHLDGNRLNNFYEGISLSSLESSQLSSYIARCTVYQCQDDGIAVQASDQSFQNTCLYENIIFGNAGNGISLNSASKMHAFIYLNQSNSNILSGISLNTQYAGSLTSQLNNNFLFENGIHSAEAITSGTGAGMCLSISNNYSNGVYLLHNAPGSIMYLEYPPLNNFGGTFEVDGALTPVGPGTCQ